MKQLKKLLVIVDPDNAKDFVMERAILIAFHYRSEVLLLMNKPNVLSQEADSPQRLASRFFSSQKQLFTEHYESQLAALKDRFEGQGIETSTCFSADKNTATLLMRKIREYQPDMVLKSIQKQGTLSRILITNTDWRLVKNCPAPLLLVKAQPWAVDGAVMSAVDPLHAKAQQNQLDHLLMDTVTSLAASLHLNKRVFHCYFPDITTMFPKAMDAEHYVKQVRKAHWEKVQELVSAHNIADDEVIMTRGDVVRTLAKAVRRDRINILVLGALSRNVVEHAIVGSTAEKILYDTPCDVLIMKLNR